MNQLLYKIKAKGLFKKPKKLLLLITITVSLVLVFSIFQGTALGVSAGILPIMANLYDLTFGTVFPGEQLEKTFEVSYTDNEGSIDYRIIHKIKPINPGDSDYCQQNSNDFQRCYRNLCPYLTEFSNENEGDIRNQATISAQDIHDNWIVRLKVPAIFGHVGQDHTGGVVSENGEYGCDISIDIDIGQLCDPNEELVLNGSFETPTVTAPQQWDIFGSGTSGLGWTIEWREDIPGSWSGYTRPDPSLQEFHRGVNSWLPQEGDQYAELDTDWDGPGGSLSGEPASVKIYQDIATLPGETYTIKFYFSPRPSTDSSNNFLELSWDGEVKATTTAAGGSNTNWSEHIYTFSATGITTRLQFTDLGTADSLGTFLDNVSVKCVLPQ